MGGSLYPVGSLVAKGVMAKSTPSYQVSGNSPLWYNGKVANVGDVVNDIPGESISWLLADGFIIPVAQPVTPDVAPEPSDAPVADPSTDQTPTESAPVEPSAEAGN